MTATTLFFSGVAVGAGFTAVAYSFAMWMLERQLHRAIRDLKEANRASIKIDEGLSEKAIDRVIKELEEGDKLK